MPRPTGDQHYSRLHPERMARGDRHGSHLHPERWTRGERHWQAAFTDDQIREIRARYARGGIRYIDLAREYNVVRSTIGMVVRRETWKHVEEGPAV